MEQYTVTGMTCAACSARVEKAVAAVEGVDSVAVNLLTGSMQVEGCALPETVIQAVEQAGYGASLPDRSGGASSKAATVHDPIVTDEKGLKKRLISSLIVLIPLMYLTMGHMVGLPQLPFFSGTENALNLALTQMFLTIIVMLIGHAFFQKGFQTLWHRNPNMDSLIAVGSGAAFAYGVFAIYRMAWGLGHNDMVLVQQYAHDLYFESAAMILTLITLGKYLEARSKGKTGEAIRQLMALSPETATVLRNGQETEIPAVDVVVGDVVILRPGDRVPVDGIVLEGSSSIDQSALTGESIPVAVGPGDRVAAATVNGGGFLKFRADRVGEDTTLSQIIHLVEEAGGSKAPIARLADKIAGVFVPVVMSIALIAAVIWAIAGQNFEFCLSTAIAVLVISCPCALGLATPVAIMVGTGRGAKLGILVKSAEALETLHNVDTVILDKTGTLTTGKPVLTDLLPQGISETELLTVAYGLEQPSEHPLAEAVCSLAKDWELPLQPAKDFVSIPGRGIRAEINGAICLGGNAEFLRENNVVLEESAFSHLAQQGKTVLYFARDGVFLGAAAAMDVAKSDSKAAVDAFKQLGITPVMVTGDNCTTAQALAESVGISQVGSQVLPQDKERIVRELQEQGHKVAMIGDGINDSPALTRADVGIAIGAGTDIAMESSDIVLMRSSLMDAAAAVELSRAVMRNIRMNLFWAFFYNSLGIPIAAGALYPAFGLKLSPMLGAAAMSLSSVCVVTNALRLRFWTPKIARVQAQVSPSAPQITIPAPPEKGISAMKTVIKIEGMMCQHCVAHVNKALTGVPGVETVEVSLEEKQAVVTGSADKGALTAAVQDAGYEVTGIE